MTMAFTQFSFEIDQDQIAHLIWVSPDKSMNVFIEKTLDELSHIIDYVAGTDAIKGCVIASGKEDSFSGGADIGLINRLLMRLMMSGINFQALPTMMHSPKPGSLKRNG